MGKFFLIVFILVFSFNGWSGKLTSQTFDLDRDQCDEYFNDLPEFLKGARAVPVINTKTKKNTGWKITQIDSKGTWYKLGFRNNDIIHTVNGNSINSPSDATELYLTLRNEKKIAVSLERNGGKMELRYNIQD